MRHLTGFGCALMLFAACHNGKSTQPAPVAQTPAPASAATPAAATAPAAQAPASVTSAAPAPAAAEAAKYSCPMHADVSAKEPGKCPKCGMALVAQSAAPEAPAKK